MVMLAYLHNIAISSLDLWQFNLFLTFSAAWLLQSTWIDQTLLQMLADSGSFTVLLFDISQLEQLLDNSMGKWWNRITQDMSILFCSGFHWETHREGWLWKDLVTVIHFYSVRSVFQLSWLVGLLGGGRWIYSLRHWILTLVASDNIAVIIKYSG